MVDAIVHRLRRMATTPAIVVAAATTLTFNIAVWPPLTQRLHRYWGGRNMFDVEPAESPEALHRALEALGPDGRAFYVTLHLTADLLYPIVVGLFFALFTVRVLSALRPERPGLQRLSLLSFAFVPVDYCENACIVALNLMHPERSDTIAAVAIAATPAKWVLVATAAVLLVGSLVWLAAERLLPRSRGR